MKKIYLIGLLGLLIGTVLVSGCIEKETEEELEEWDYKIYGESFFRKCREKFPCIIPYGLHVCGEGIEKHHVYELYGCSDEPLNCYEIRNITLDKVVISPKLVIECPESVEQPAVCFITYGDFQHKYYCEGSFP